MLSFCNERQMPIELVFHTTDINQPCLFYSQRACLRYNIRAFLPHGSTNGSVRRLGLKGASFELVNIPFSGKSYHVYGTLLPNSAGWASSLSSLELPHHFTPCLSLTWQFFWLPRGHRPSVFCWYRDLGNEDVGNSLGCSRDRSTELSLVLKLLLLLWLK